MARMTRSGTVLVILGMSLCGTAFGSIVNAATSAGRVDEETVVDVGTAPEREAGCVPAALVHRLERAARRYGIDGRPTTAEPTDRVLGMPVCRRDAVAAGGPVVQPTTDLD